MTTTSAAGGMLPTLTSTLIDLSVTVSERLPGVWPSHHPFEREVTKMRPPYFTAPSRRFHARPSRARSRSRTLMVS